MGRRREDGRTAEGGVILGISCDYHDAAAALLVDGRVVAAAEEERFTRVKHDSALPKHAVRACLEVAGLPASAIDHVVFYEKPLVKAARFLATRRRQGPSGMREFLSATPDLLGRNLFIGARVAAMLRRLGAHRPPPLQYVEHHRSHAAGAFFASPFDHAAVLTVDGLGEWATASISHGAHHRLTLLEEMRFPHSLGLVYSFITAYCGFRPNGDEYKLMGLAPYGIPAHRDALAELIAVNEDGSVRVDARRLGWYGRRGLRSRRLHRMLGGPPRSSSAELTPREADLAASVQRLTEDALLAMVGRAHELTGEDRLCLSGGVALNSVANGRVLREGPFADLWIQPAAGDAGSALGAALSYWHEHLGRARVLAAHDSMSGAYLGPEIVDDEVARALEDAGVADCETIADEDELATRIALRLAAGDIVGVCRGRMEFGPRALGHRSILADPRSATVRADLNGRVKGRESFRPFAPAVLAEEVADWFELEGPSPYMLIVAPVRPERRVAVDHEPATIVDRSRAVRSEIPACTHVDGSARIQTVDAVSSPDFHRLLQAFRDATGCPVLLNTSFNRAGEPIVADAADAIRSARAAGLDLLVLGRTLVTRAALSDAVRS
jgi:carbamoyltransferase